MYSRKWHILFSDKRGGSVLFAVVASLVVLSVLGAAIARLHGSGTHTEMQENGSDAAYYAALSGLSYASKIIELANANTYGSNWEVSSLDGTYTLPGNRQFVLTTAADAGNDYKIVSRGTSALTGQDRQANYILSATKTYIPVPNLGDYNFVNPSNRPEYAEYAESQTRDVPTALDNAQIKTKNITVGKDYTYGFGNIWYAGNETGYSTNGVSSFGSGFRMFFTFKFATNIGDGFVVSVLNAAKNNYLSSGGDSAEGGLLGYGGDSRVYNSKDGGFSSTILEYVDKSGFTKGLNPPKFGIEVDTYRNNGGTWEPSATKVECTGDNGLMNDSGSADDHVGIMYWGTNDPYVRKTCMGPGASFEGNTRRYSDARHGSGSNAGNTSGNKLKFMTFEVGRTYFFRMDVVKSGSRIDVKSWVGTCSSGDLNSSCTKQVYGTSVTNHEGTLSDTRNDFSNTSKLSKLDYVYVNDTHYYTTDEATAFSKFMWGFTSGSGVATQEIDFRNISVSFRE